MASAVALGHDGPRLRSRRIRSGRSHRLPWLVVVAVLAFASAVGFEGAKLSTNTTPSPAVVDAATSGQQRFVADLRPIHAEIEHGIVTVGLVVAAYESGQIKQPELQRRLAEVLAGYRDAAVQVDAVVAPPGLRPVVLAYADAISALEQSGEDLSKAYDDGDQARVAAALALSLQATAHFHDLLDVGPPPRD